MHIEEAFTSYLLAQTGLTALIGRRLYPDETPQEVDLRTQSAVVYQQPSPDEKIHTHQGQTKSETPYYQFTAYAPTRAGARAVAEQIKAALNDYRGVMGGLTVEYITLINELADTLTTADGIVKVSAITLEYEIAYIRS